MKILLYVLLAIVLLLVVFFAWFFLSYAKVPELRVAEQDTELQRLAKVDDYLTELQQAEKFNGAVLLARDHEPLLLKTYGYTDHTLKEPLTPQSSFRLASVSKQFTAAAVLRAQTLNLLDIDQPVATYLVGFPYPEVQVRHLLNQTSGVPDNYMELAEK
ncbi:MAG: serine hydrolase, partial [Bacteroidota bacterium]